MNAERRQRRYDNLWIACAIALRHEGLTPRVVWLIRRLGTRVSPQSDLARQARVSCFVAVALYMREHDGATPPGWEKKP